MRLYRNHLLSHGSGALRQWCFSFGRRTLRLSVGGYGNVAPPFGQWRVYPSITAYRGTAYYVNWFSLSLCYLPH